MDTVATTTPLNDANARALALMTGLLSDEDIIRVYEASEGEGPIADAAAVEMERRGLDY